MLQGMHIVLKHGPNTNKLRGKVQQTWCMATERFRRPSACGGGADPFAKDERESTGLPNAFLAESLPVDMLPSFGDGASLRLCDLFDWFPLFAVPVPVPVPACNDVKVLGSIFACMFRTHMGLRKD